mgnify:CR=1 FL=1
MFECPCCNEKTLTDDPGHYDICSNCGWEDDPIQREDPDYAGGANEMSLNEAREAYKQGKKAI